MRGAHSLPTGAKTLDTGRTTIADLLLGAGKSFTTYAEGYADAASAGPFATKGFVSHVQMEHSLVVRFLEYNFIGNVGQLGYNDAKVANIGSMLDAKAVGFPVPEI